MTLFHLVAGWLGGVFGGLTVPDAPGNASSAVTAHGASTSVTAFGASTVVGVMGASTEVEP